MLIRFIKMISVQTVTAAVRRYHLRKIYMSNRYTTRACGNTFDIFSAILSKVAVGALGQWPLDSIDFGPWPAMGVNGYT